MLSREGMSLVLLGSAVHVLGQRLNQTRQYEAAQGKRKLRVYLVCGWKRRQCQSSGHVQYIGCIRSLWGVVSSSRYLGGAGGRAARGNSSAAEFSARCRVVL